MRLHMLAGICTCAYHIADIHIVEGPLQNHDTLVCKRQQHTLATVVDSWQSLGNIYSICKQKFQKEMKDTVLIYKPSQDQMKTSHTYQLNRLQLPHISMHMQGIPFNSNAIVSMC